MNTDYIKQYYYPQHEPLIMHRHISIHELYYNIQKVYQLAPVSPIGLIRKYDTMICT